MAHPAPDGAASPHFSDPCSPHPQPRRRRNSTSALLGDPAVLRRCLSYLPAPEVCACRRVCCSWAEAVTDAALLWTEVLEASYPGCPAKWLHPTRFGPSQVVRAFAVDGLCRLRVAHGVQSEWYDEPQAREGHAMALHEPSGLLVMFGGFLPDAAVHWRQLPADLTDLQHPSARHPWHQWTPWTAQGQGSFPNVRYGHRMVPLPGGTADRCSFLCTGGSQMGGYLHMIWEPWVLAAERGDGGWQFSWTPCSIPVQQHYAVAYHSVCVDGSGKLWVSGGLNEGELCRTVCSVTPPAEPHEPWQTSFGCFLTGGGGAAGPCPRFGHSSSVVAGQLYVCGGYTGSGMYHLQDGDDLCDIWVTGVSADELQRWRRIDIEPSAAKCLGRCHAMAVLGTRYLVFYAGGAAMTNQLSVFDTVTQRLHEVDVATGRKPSATLAHVAVARGSALLSWGGCPQQRSVSMNQTYVIDFDVLQGGAAEAEALRFEWPPKQPPRGSVRAWLSQVLSGIVSRGQPADDGSSDDLYS